jgi:pullulanase
MDKPAAKVPLLARSASTAAVATTALTTTDALAQRRSTHFMLWSPAGLPKPPNLLIGPYGPKGEFDLTACTSHALQANAALPGLWEIAAAACLPAPDKVYGYWFEVTDQSGFTSGPGGTILMTDPVAFAIDRANPAPPPRTDDALTVGAPAAVVRFRGGRLEPSDPIAADLSEDPANYRAQLPSNTSMVIYELPTRWVSPGHETATSSHEVGLGTFDDVLALISPEDDSPQFSETAALKNREHLVKLGINALELLPPADSPQFLEWGYGTANYFAADFDLGRKQGALRSAATASLRKLIVACHKQGMRFIQDVVMGFAVDQPYFWIAPQFFLGGTPFGGKFWSYHDGPQVTGFDPVGGGVTTMFPARNFMQACVSHWLSFFHIDGVRIDYVEGINDWNFLREYSGHARKRWNELGGTDDRFWVVAEELGHPAALAASGSADASWDEGFKRSVRPLVLGDLPEGRDFGSAVRHLIDCRARGFADGRMVVNYIGSHDLTNDGFSDRFYSWLDGRGVIFKERPIKLAFTCLLTAVGIPMILAGDEFADERDVAIGETAGRNKQIDPVNFERFSDPWRQEIFAYVARLVRQRTTSAALARNECDIIHVDTTPGRRIAVWQRGVGDDLVVVVANFSDFVSAGGVAGEYVIPTWPGGDLTWFEVSQSDDPRRVARPGREPLFPWEAKIYMTKPRRP